MNINNPLITVITPVYNAESFIKETIESVLNQTFEDFEYILLDDGSSDSSAVIIQSYDDERIRYVACPHDFIGTLNKGLALAVGKYIALIDHDDIMLPDRLRMQYEFMESHPYIAACGGYMYSFGIKEGTLNVPVEHLDIIKSMLLYSPIQNPTGFIRRTVLLEHNIKYERGYEYSADYKLWSEIAKIGKLATIPKVLTLYRMHEEQTSSKYREQCLEGGQKVKFEMLDYFISHLKKGDEFADAIYRDVIQVIEELGAFGFFSGNVFFIFMYELIGGLLKNGTIEI